MRREYVAKAIIEEGIGDFVVGAVIEDGWPQV
jgi:hypothetical protein